MYIGAYLEGYNYPDAMSTVTVNLPGVVALSEWYLDGNLKLSSPSFVPTYDVHYDELPV